MTVTINEDVQTRFQAVAAPEEDFSAFLAAAAEDAIQRRERQAAGRAEMQAMLDRPRYRHDDSMAEMRRKYNLPNISHLSHDELVEQTKAALAKLPPEKIAEAEHLGLI